MARERISIPKKVLVTRFAVWLEAAMAERNISQLELAQKSRVSQGFINGVLRNGRLFADDEKVRRLAHALGQEATEPLAAVYLDRIERLLADAPATTRALFKKILHA